MRTWMRTWLLASLLVRQLTTAWVVALFSSFRSLSLLLLCSSSCFADCVLVGRKVARQAYPVRSKQQHSSSSAYVLTFLVSLFLEDSADATVGAACWLVLSLTLRTLSHYARNLFLAMLIHSEHITRRLYTQHKKTQHIRRHSEQSYNHQQLATKHTHCNWC